MRGLRGGWWIGGLWIGMGWSVTRGFNGRFEGKVLNGGGEAEEDEDGVEECEGEV